MSRHQWLHDLLSIDAVNLADASLTDKEKFLTAFDHFGEPFLLALDGIDTGAYVRIVPKGSLSSQTRDGQGTWQVKTDTHPIYLAFSTTQGRYYEVRLSSWNCPCAQFVCGMHTNNDTCDTFLQKSARAVWGGRHAVHGTVINYCKHLIAAFLLEYGSSLFAKHLKYETVENFDFTL